uniref:Uncharacterized protein n=1 Tax=Solanum lycopersicum TaxID=4081 RepID=A0A3Q7G3U4_SOLLC
MRFVLFTRDGAMSKLKDNGIHLTVYSPFPFGNLLRFFRKGVDSNLRLEGALISMLPRLKQFKSYLRNEKRGDEFLREVELH